MPLSASLLLLSLAQGSLRFLGSPQCPTPAAVEEQLRLVDPKTLESPARHVVTLEEQSGGLQVRLLDEGGGLLEERLVPGSKGCAEWARIVAALLATWETDLGVSDLSLPSETAGPPGQAPAARQPTLEKRPSWRGEIGLGASGSVASNGSFAFGGELLTDLAPPTGAFGGQLVFEGSGVRSAAVDTGAVNWQRFALGLGGRGRLGTGALQFEFGAELLAGLLSLKGQMFPVPLSSVVFDPGLGLLSRGLWSFAPHWLTWLAIGASFWPESHELDVGSVSGSAVTGSGRPIPPVDVAVTIGFSVTGDL